ncbi:MAG TPA: hypothetical protein DCZ95_12490 [Verrucomicrobia bacterium]|nr:hypothetical protein [Verrucomicrobiota bacterium]
MEHLAGGASAIIGMFVIVFLLIVAILGLLMPLFVYHIRNDLRQINSRLGVLVDRAIEAGFKGPQAG